MKVHLHSLSLALSPNPPFVYPHISPSWVHPHTEEGSICRSTPSTMTECVVCSIVNLARSENSLDDGTGRASAKAAKLCKAHLTSWRTHCQNQAKNIAKRQKAAEEVSYSYIYHADTTFTTAAIPADSLIRAVTLSQDASSAAAVGVCEVDSARVPSAWAHARAQRGSLSSLLCHTIMQPQLGCPGMAGKPGPVPRY